MGKGSLGVVFSLAAILLIGTPAEAGRNPSCEARVAGYLDRLKVDRSDIRAVSLETQRGGGERGQVLGVLAWVSLHSCTGNVVIRMSTQCRVREVYGRGDCDIGAGETLR